MRKERADHTLQPTALVNEAYLRLTHTEPKNWDNRAHFFSAAARAMREVLIDHARVHCAEKRGGDRPIRIELTDGLACQTAHPELLLALDAVLDRLREIDPRAAQVVEFRYFSGLSVEETAIAMEVSPKTVKRDWNFARVWLERQLRPIQHPPAKA